MAATVARMTKHELKEIIESTVEQKLLKLLGNPDQGLVLKKTIKDRLLRQRKTVASGQRGESLAVIVKRLGLTDPVMKECVSSREKNHKMPYLLVIEN